MKIFLIFTIIYPKLTRLLLRQFRLGNNLPTHIRETTDFPRQKPRHLAMVNFKGCDIIFPYRFNFGVKNH